MKINLRLITSLIIVAAAVAGSFTFLEVRSEKKRLTDDLERRAIVLSEGLKESAETLLAEGKFAKLQQLIERFGDREGLLGVILYNDKGEIHSASSNVFSALKRPYGVLGTALANQRGGGQFERVAGKSIFVYASTLEFPEQKTGAIAMFNDTDYIDERISEISRHNFVSLLILSVFIVLTTLVVVRWSIVGPIAQAADWIKQLRLGGSKYPPNMLGGDILGPLAREVNQMVKSLEVARATAEKEAQLRVSGEAVWTPEKLKEQARSILGNSALYVVSNREPYMHVRDKKKIQCVVPASGMVAAMEPVMRACGGLWVAHGSGSADRETVDVNNKLRVPPDDPAYVLKRVWLTKEEETGHYYGFSNEGLWPLCHITHTRPIFRLDDWIQYQKVNAKFAQSVLKEIEDEKSPLILIQDYHFALLPLLIKEKRPDARVGIFWHIPWPNSESFSICPWKQEILLGMLSADIVGFHIQLHCNNFLDTVDNTLECKINWEQFTVERAGHGTQVKPFPISVGLTELGTPDPESAAENAAKVREALFRDYGIRAKFIGVGVDRLDYTKGILERFRGIERFLEKYPEYVGQFTFVELGAPSRTHIQKYHDFIAEVEKTAESINWRFQTKDWKPILFLKGHHPRADILPYYKAADLCLVTSLHDGMNLVCKEFIAERSDEDGVLILSQFTGASRELREALIVNPYDTEALSECLRLALEMPQEQRKDRMKRMRAVVQDKNIYRWAANLVNAIAQLPSKPAESAVPEENKV